MFDNQGPTPDQIASLAAEKFAGQLANEEAQRIIDSYPEGEYIKLQAANRVAQEMQAGRVRTPQEYVKSFRASMQVESETFKARMRPGYMRSEYNPQIPADQEVRDYLAERRAQSQAMKEAGQIVGRVGPHSDDLRKYGK